MRTFVQRQNRIQRPGFTSPKPQATLATSAPNFVHDHQCLDKPDRFGFDFARIPIYQGASSRIEAKLAIGSPSDPCEQEAHRVSEQVGSMAERYRPLTSRRGTDYFWEHNQKREPASERVQMSSTGSRSLEKAA